MEGEAFYSMIDDMAGVAGGPNSDVTRVAISAATLGSVLPMSPAHANSSYQLHFVGPALQCTSWNHTAVARFQQQSCKYFRANFCPGEYDSNKQALRYMSWTNDYPDGPYDYDFYNETKPPFAPVSNTSNPYPFDDTSDDLYVYVAQASYEGTGMLADPSPTSLGPDLLVTCAFRNASYTIDFSFNESQQTTKMTRHEFLDFYDFSDYGNIDDGAPPEYSYNAMWDAFSTLVIGYMSYLAAADGGEPTNTQGTQISNTLLDPLKRSWPNADAFGADMETMFNNVTMSYFSNPSLTTNASTSPIASTTYSVTRNVYSYDASELWKAYGSGIGVACLCVLIGFRAMLLNGATYKNSWSSIFRSTQAADFSSLFRNATDDLDGAEPAPPTVKNASVIYTREGFRLHEPSTTEARPASDKDSALGESAQPSLQPGPGDDNPHLERQVSDAQSWAKRASTRIQNIDGQDAGVDHASSVSERDRQAATQQPQPTVRRKPISSATAEVAPVPDHRTH